MQFDKEVIQNSSVLKDIKKYYNLNKLTWQLQVLNDNTTSICLNKKSKIKNLYFLKPDDRLSFRRLEIWGYDEIVPFNIVSFSYINNRFDESSKSIFTLFTSGNQNYCIFFNSDYFLRDSILVNIYE